MANSVAPDQTASEWQCDHGLHCLPWAVWILRISMITKFIFLCPPNRRGGGDILLMVRILSTSMLLLVCTQAPEPNEWILTKLAQTHYWEGGKKWLDFGDLELIFRVTLALWIIKFWQKRLLCTLSLEPDDGFWPNFIYCNIGVKDLIRFWWPWPNFQGHHTIKTVKMSLACTLSPEPNSDFDGKEMIRIWWP